MTSHNHDGGSEASIEGEIREVLQRAQSNLSDKFHRCEDTVREAPANSVLVAGLVGYFLHIVPIGALLSGILRLLSALIRPAIVLYVAAKFIDLLRSSAVTTSKPAHR